jgi:hypothetical protein
MYFIVSQFLKERKLSLGVSIGLDVISIDAQKMLVSTVFKS